MDENKDQTTEETTENQDTQNTEDTNIETNENGDNKGDENKDTTQDDDKIEEKDPELEDAIEDNKKGDDKDTEDLDALDGDKIKNYVDKKIKEGTAEVNEKLFKQTVESKIDKLIANNPDYKPFEKEIKKWVFHENRMVLIKRGMPVATAALEVMAPRLQRLGAKKEREANKEAKDTQGKGSSTPANAGKGSTPDFSKMSPDEITKIAEQVKNGTYPKS